MTYDAGKVADFLGRIEALGEDILSDKHSITELEKRRNKNREALRVLMNQERTFDEKGRTVAKKGKTWVCLGDMFIKLPTSEIRPILEEDQQKLEEEMSKLREGLKPKLQNLRHLEKKPELKGFDLKPLQMKELHLFPT